jgi:hypothetical protein
LSEIIFNKNNASGVLHHSYTKDPPNTDEENELDNQYLNNGNANHVRVDSDSSKPIYMNLRASHAVEIDKFKQDPGGNLDQNKWERHFQHGQKLRGTGIGVWRLLHV